MHTSPTRLSKALLQSRYQPGKLPVTFPHLGNFSLPERVLQFGTGVLLRGLPDYFIDKANRRGIFNGRVVVVKSTDAGSADAFTEQDNLYTVCVRGVEKGKQMEKYVVNASISRTLSAKGHWKEILNCAHQPEMQIILSNTTEVGIQLTDDHVSAGPPSSFPGKLTAFLLERYRAFGGSPKSGMVIVPCELIVDNGKKLKEIVLELSRRNGLEPAFIDWVEGHNTFCNSLVDRIVPGKPDEAETAKMTDLLGYTDELLAVSEVYRLWAIEGDEKVKKILSFQKADEGMLIQPDITPYRERKLRLLNGTHTISVGLGYLCGLQTVGDCMKDPAMSHFITNVMHQEIVPAVPVDEESARVFADEVLDRFRNPFVVHPLISITLQYTSKMKMRNVQTFLNYYQKYGTAPAYLSLGFAAYLLFMKAVKTENGNYYGALHGQFYPIKDEFAGYFYEQWQALKDHDYHAFTQTILANTQLWDTDLNQLPDFTQTVSHYLENLIGRGAVHTIQQFTHAAL